MSSDTRSMVRATVFAAGGFALPLISRLVERQSLAGVVLPDPAEHPHLRGDIFGLKAQLDLHKLPHVICSSAQLSELPEKVESWKCSLGLIATFPNILPERLINAWQWGVFNFHGSGLPDYRGPSPLYWQIRNREPQTTLTFHRAEKEADRGAIVEAREIPIQSLDTVQCLSNQLSWLAVSMAESFIQYIESNSALPSLSPMEGVAHSELHELRKAPRPTWQDNQIHFNTMSADDIAALARAANGQPNGAWCFIKNIPTQVLQASAVEMPTYKTREGTVIHVSEQRGLIVTCIGGAVCLDILAGVDGVFSGYAFAERFHIDVGINLTSSQKQSIFA